MQEQQPAPDPARQYPGPEAQEAEQQEWPGRTGEMQRRPDHGEHSYQGHGRLTGRRAVITGGDSGIGRAVAIAYAREGADLVISYLPEEEEDARETAHWVREAGRTVVTAPGDLREEEYCEQLIALAESALGGVDILVNNAAFQMNQPEITDITTAQFDRVMKTNLYALFWLCRAAVPRMAPGSSIINLSSIQAAQSSPGLLDYATTKAGITAFTKALAAGLADRGIRVNAIAPGPVWTPLIPATMPPEKVAQFGANTPLGRVGQPAELAPAFVFFASPESSYITGELLAVTGGRPMS
ncbi:MAG TPA: glucose 1-dehydrogenase [Natronosporangium sp.]|nr:glucose 1-dehydrogenase [Natronosporangium sp.]